MENTMTTDNANTKLRSDSKELSTNGSQEQPKTPDFEAVANMLYNNSDLYHSGDTVEGDFPNRVIERLYNSPEALAALGLCKKEKAWLENAPSDLRAAYYSGSKDYFTETAKPYMNRLEAELNEAKQQLKAVRAMRDRMKLCLYNLSSESTYDADMDWYRCDARKLIAEAEDQKAMEAQ